MLQFQPQEHLLHSYIVVSQSEQARERLALDLTAAMLCRSDGVRPCRACRDCRKVYDHVHPDVIYVEPDRSGKTPVIKVDQIRSVAATAYILPSEAEKKVYVLRQAELMNLNAQNAFLKLLEEPPRQRGVYSCGRKPGFAADDGALALRAAARPDRAAAGVGGDARIGGRLPARGRVAGSHDAPALVSRARGHGGTDACGVFARGAAPARGAAGAAGADAFAGDAVRAAAAPDRDL